MTGSDLDFYDLLLLEAALDEYREEQERRLASCGDPDICDLSEKKVARLHKRIVKADAVSEKIAKLMKEFTG